MAVYRIGKQQPGGVQHKCLSGLTQYTVGQSGTNTMDPYSDAYEALIRSDIEMVGVGMPNGLGRPTSILNNLGTTHKRFTVFALPMVPYGTGSVDRLVNSSTYDAMHTAIAEDTITAGFDEDSAIRCGHEYNSGAGDSGTQGFMWATKHTDPYTGQPVGLANYQAGAAKVEKIWRDAGYTGYFAWSGGQGDTSAAKIEDAIPTHGDPSLTVWDWDWYSHIGWNGTKNDAMTFYAKDLETDAKYLDYCRKHKILYAHSEYGHTSNPSSPYAANDEGQWYRAFYGNLATNADVKAWAGHYQVNQLTNGIVQEGHLIALSVNTPGGAPSGVAATAKYVADYPPGALDPTTGKPAPNIKGTANTLANSGSLQSSSSAGVNWVWTPDPNKQNAMTSWRETFGGFGPTGGAAGLTAAVVPPILPATTGGAASPNGRKVRGHLRQFR
jgi:hypothetical protein